jgi:hypothetical protein
LKIVMQRAQRVVAIDVGAIVAEISRVMTSIVVAERR